MDNFCFPRMSRRKFLAESGRLIAVPAIAPGASRAPAPAEIFTPDGAIRPPAWIGQTTRMAFLSPGQLNLAIDAGVQVVHTNLVWPYFPLRRDGGGLSKSDAQAQKELTDRCHKAGMKLCLGLPPFPPSSLVAAHPDWRIHPDRTGAVLKLEPKDNDLGTRNCCNLGPWGDYLIEVCGEMVADFGVDGYSFDGNYHPAICYCPACESAYRTDRKRDLPPKIDLDNVLYREYLVWRGERLEDHYRRLQRRIKGANPDAVLMSWTVNAGRYGHFLYSPRAMSTKTNRLFDLPMQEWWLDETNIGASIVPSFGAAYVRAAAGDRTAASEPYLMTRGNPYGSDSFPQQERRTRCLLSAMNGGALAESFGWPGHQAGVGSDLKEIGKIAPFLTNTKRLPWAALLVSEQTRQFYAYKDIAERFLPHPLGVFRAMTEEHLPVSLINDWDLNPTELKRHAVLILPNAAALSDAQVAAVREYVRDGGGLVATVETSLCDEIGRPRKDFALGDLFGVSYLGRPSAPLERAQLDANFAVAIDENYWRQRVGLGTLQWTEHLLVDDVKLKELVPSKSVIFRGPQALVSEPGAKDEVVVRLKPEGWTKPPVPAVILRNFGKGRVAYLPAGIDAANWSYSYPYQRRLLAMAVEWAASKPSSIIVKAPMCVQAAYYKQPVNGGSRTIIHLFNGLNTTGGHGNPAVDVPLREEVVPIHGIEIRFTQDSPRHFFAEPGHTPLISRKEADGIIITVPPLGIHSIVVAEL